jgi:NADH:ubiquinone oxidoreductase subunit 5 (subunit L)/multisubunit Na+/H+ antiporter MnhA subunit
LDLYFKRIEMVKKKINWRSFTSIYMGFSIILMAATGIVLYISPPGRVAFWSNWFFVGLTKTEWHSVHTIFSFLFLVSGIFHIAFNWKLLINYLRGKAKESLKVRREFVLTSFTVFIIFTGVYLAAPPFNYVMDFGENIANSWTTPETEPPVPHAELLTVSDFAKTINKTTNELIMLFANNGYAVSDTNEIINNLAKRYGISPGTLYNSIKFNKSSNVFPAKYTQGSGIGRKYLSELLKENNIIWEDGIARLNKEGIKVNEDGKIKNIAVNNNISPIVIIKALGID